MANGTIGVSQIDVLTTSGTGTLSIVPPATNTNRTLTLPDGTGTLVANGVNSSIVSGTAVTAATGSPTSIDFTSIPSWAKRITVMFSGFSTSGTSIPLIQLGDAGGIETSGYSGSGGFLTNTSSANTATYTDGFRFTHTHAAASVYHAHAFITKIDGNNWVATLIGGNSASAAQIFSGGSKTLSDTLTQVRITTVNGTDTFDAGTINILYE